jgi:hypothetical protein
VAKAAVLNIDILAVADKALSEFDKIKAKATSTNALMKVAAIGAATAIIGGLGEATKAAAEHEVNVARLSTAYKDAGLSTKDMKGSLDDIEAASRRTGQSTEDNIAAYTLLVAATRSTSKAHSELATAEDLAAFKGISVSDAARAITQAAGGNTRALKEMGIQTKDASGKQLSAQAIMEKLTAAVHGQADAFGNTAVGQMARYHESLDQTKEKVGEALLPVLQQLLAILQPIFTWLSNNTAILKVLAPILGIVAGVVLAVSAATKVWVAIQTILDVVLADNPIGAIILAIAGLIAIIIIVVSHWRDFLGIIQAVWGWLENLGSWILGNWKIIVDVLLGPLGLIITNFQTIYGAIQDVIGALGAIGHAVSDALGWLGKLPKKAGGIAGKIESLNPFSLPGGGGSPGVAPVNITVYATPGDDLPEVVYQALRSYQRRHVRPELRPLFSPALR